MLSVLNFRFTFLQKSMTFFLFLRNNLKEVKDERPSLLCMEVPDTACAVAYDRCHHHTLIFPICRTHQKHFSLVQNALVAGNLCCRKVDASSAIGALIGDTGQLLPYHRHAPSAQEQRHQSLYPVSCIPVLGIQVSCFLITVMLLLLKNNVTNIEGTTWTWLEFEPVAPSPGSPAATSTATA